MSLSSDEKAELTKAVTDAAKPLLLEINKIITAQQRMKALQLAAGFPGATADTTVAGAKKIMEYVTAELGDAAHKEGDSISHTFYGLNAPRAGDPDNGQCAFKVQYSDSKIVITKGNDEPFDKILPGQWESIKTEMLKRFWRM